MEATIESYVITEAQKNSRSWEPEPYLSAAPLQVAEGAASGEYIISVVLGDPAYDEMRVWLEANAERAVVNTNTLYPEWSAGISVDIGDLYTYAGTIYSCIQAHVTQSDWTPPVVPALWLAETPEGTIGDWTQPAGGHDAYEKYDQVRHSGFIWESAIDANVWEPGVVADVWVQISEDEPVAVSAWLQPAGAHDAYQTGDQVTFDGSTWESTVDDNVWSPLVYGWIQV